MESMLVFVVLSLCGVVWADRGYNYIAEEDVELVERVFVMERNESLSAISSNCMRCICEVEGCERMLGKCQMDVGSLSCGPFQIKDPYWQDCGRPGRDWQSCTKEMQCSQTCVHKYMDRYAVKCTQGRTPTCRDYAMIHNGGPKGCQKGLEAYWAKVKACCLKKFGGNC